MVPINMVATPSAMSPITFDNKKCHVKPISGHSTAELWLFLLTAILLGGLAIFLIVQLFDFCSIEPFAARATHNDSPNDQDEEPRSSWALTWRSQLMAYAKRASDREAGREAAKRGSGTDEEQMPSLGTTLFGSATPALYHPLHAGEYELQVDQGAPRTADVTPHNDDLRAARGSVTPGTSSSGVATNVTEGDEDDGDDEAEDESDSDGSSMLSKTKDQIDPSPMLASLAISEDACSTEKSSRLEQSEKSPELDGGQSENDFDVGIRGVNGTVKEASATSMPSARGGDAIGSHDMGETVNTLEQTQLSDIQEQSDIIIEQVVEVAHPTEAYFPRRGRLHDYTEDQTGDQNCAIGDEYSAGGTGSCSGSGKKFPYVPNCDTIDPLAQRRADRIFTEITSGRKITRVDRTFTAGHSDRCDLPYWLSNFFLRLPILDEDES